MIIFDAAKFLARALLSMPKIDRDRERWAADGASEKSPLDALARVAVEMRELDEKMIKRRARGWWWRR